MTAQLEASMTNLRLASSNEKIHLGGIQYLTLKEFTKALKWLYGTGGQRKRIADKVLSLLGRAGASISPLEGMKVTNHGEGRIRHCVKYDLGDGYRLVTIQHSKFCAFCYVGNHDDTDQWLRSNCGLTLSIDDAGQLIKTVKSGDAGTGRITRDTDLSDGFLIERLGSADQDVLLTGLSPSVLGQIYKLDATDTDQGIELICHKIPDVEKHLLVYDVLCLLLAGDVEKALRRIGVATGRVKPLEDLSDQEIMEVQNGDEVRRIVVGSPEHSDFLNQMAKTAPYLEWLLFLHPEQQRVVDEDFKGAAQLSGVSGAGKTCVVVKRAIRLARDGKEQVFIITLNRSLAGLLETLVDAAAPDERIRARIKTASFFELCQGLLEHVYPENKDGHRDISLKLEEHVDEVFRQYYRCWENFEYAEVLWPIHKSLSARGISAENYLRQEFDWVRSALSPSQMNEYLTIERTGRKLPLSKDFRKCVLEGLDGWQQKMRACGVIDYLGLTTALTNRIDELVPICDAMLIDEVQDFGTTELAILRKLVREEENDIFICGDIAQHVLPKHRSLTRAGIKIPNDRSRKILRNYRNSREILKAAYHVLLENLDDTQLDSGDLEILDPQYANRSSPKPCVVRANSLEDEYAYARSFLESDCQENPDHKNCIAFAGYSLREVEIFAQSQGLPLLNGMHAAINQQLVISDLEQTKGYEFNVVIVLNCSEGVLPPINAPDEEAFRSGCQLYVAMTRARDELYLSHSGAHSHWLEKAAAHLNFDDWSELWKLSDEFKADKPKRHHEFESGNIERHQALELNGRQFLYTSWGVGLSPDAQEKISALVDGIGMVNQRIGGRVKWKDMASLRHDLELSPRVKMLFGARVQLEVRKLLTYLAC
jgi:superfamily I DNA/RNA helicase